MKAENLIKIIGSEFYAGVPDSQLKALCDCLMNMYGIDGRHHIIAANEGNAAALAAGYHLATGRIPAVYLQNSGEGNIINPLASLMNERVYAIPCVYIIGWRGQPGIHDEPQHIYQGEITCRLLEDMGVEYFVIDKETADEDAAEVMQRFRSSLYRGRSVAFVVCKDTLSYDNKASYTNRYSITREEIIRHIVSVSGNSPVVCTTGKASRELFEIREGNSQGHEKDFLTVGSMGHASSIALGIALNRPEQRVWCIDGDGAVLMHMGAMAVIGSLKPKNLIHVVINNEAHETVGGMPTAVQNLDLCGVAKACGYFYVCCETDLDGLDKSLLDAAERHELCFIEIKCATGSRDNLGRPGMSTLDNKEQFIKYVSKAVFLDKCQAAAELGGRINQRDE